MLTEDEIDKRLRVWPGTVSVLSSDEANEIAETFDELRRSRDKWRRLWDIERRRAEAAEETLRLSGIIIRDLRARIAAATGEKE